MTGRHGRSLVLAALMALGACAPAPEAADPTIPSPTAPGDPSPTPTVQDIMELEPFAPLEPGTYIIDPDLDPSTALRVEYEIPFEGWSQWIGAHWPHVPADDPVGAVLNRIPKYVASTTLKTVEWNNATLLEGDVPRAVAALKDARSGEIQVHGSWGLLQTLIEHDLIDEYRLWTFPVLLGSGKRLFGAESTPAGVELIDSATSSTGVVINRYRRAGEIRYGSFEVDERGGVEALWTDDEQR